MIEWMIEDSVLWIKCFIFLGKYIYLIFLKNLVNFVDQWIDLQWIQEGQDWWQHYLNWEYL